MNGSEPSTSEGRVEICLSNTYGTVCDDLWDEQAARVACGGRNGKARAGGSSSIMECLVIIFIFCGKELH